MGGKIGWVVDLKSRPNKNKNYDTNVRYSNQYFHLVVSFHGINSYSLLLLFFLFLPLGTFFFFFFGFFFFFCFFFFFFFVF